jgi:hypothetical protein
MRPSGRKSNHCDFKLDDKIGVERFMVLLFLSSATVETIKVAAAAGFL